VRQALVEVKEEISAMRREAEEDLRHRRDEVKRVEDRLLKREESLDTKSSELSAREQRLDKLQHDMARVRQELEVAAKQHQRELERIAHLTSQEAKEQLMSQVVDAAKRDAMGTVREIEQQAREEGERRAQQIVNHGR